MPRRCLLNNLGLVPYTLAWEQQRSLVAQRIADPSLDDVLLLLEHPPVYSLGQGASLDFLKFDPAEVNWEVHRVERGGEVTYHCPGQIVGYPILNLRYYQQDLHWYLRQLEEVLIRVLGVYGLKGERISGLTGVWLEGCKVAAIGIKVTRWITMHGFALNVCPDLSGFERIIPCGIVDKSVGSLAQFIPGITVVEVLPLVVRKFAEVFEVEWAEVIGNR
jgi:lipoyl(octanoyl) transferase